MPMQSSTGYTVKSLKCSEILFDSERQLGALRVYPPTSIPYDYTAMFTQKKKYL